MNPGNKLSLHGVDELSTSFDSLFDKLAVCRLALPSDPPSPGYALRVRLLWNSNARFYECSFYWEEMSEAEIAHRQQEDR